ncbi:YceI family protein [Pedobacter gandavensis]|uniref:YceI family protein n=1 Tax=Pedobacter gandavensis TaxID=2679963 RepID=UPI002931C4A2|nr:YceI family protein [Pedobacter gandavensis]
MTNESTDKSLPVATWKNDKDHSRLGFTVTHMMINDIVGQFNTFEVTITASKPDFSDASIELRADVKSVDTNSEMRDEDLRSADFFDAAKYPTIHFKSTAIEGIMENQYKLSGDITMHGITKEITVDFIYRGTVLNPNTKKTTAGFQVLTTLKRSDFKIGLILPFDGLKDDVLIKADGEFPKQ